MSVNEGSEHHDRAVATPERTGLEFAARLPVVRKVLHAATPPAADAQGVVREERRGDDTGLRMERGDHAAAGQHVRILFDDAGDGFAVDSHYAPRRRPALSIAAP
jgi:hypothetical protein